MDYNKEKKFPVPKVGPDSLANCFREDVRLDDLAMNTLMVVSEDKLTPRYIATIIVYLKIPWMKQMRDTKWQKWVNDPEDPDGRVVRSVIQKLEGEYPPYL